MHIYARPNTYRTPFAPRRVTTRNPSLFDIFDSWFTPVGSRNTAQMSKLGWLSVDEDAERYTIRGHAVGVAPEDLSIQFLDQTLEVRATRSLSVPEGAKALMRELSSGTWEESITLQDAVDVEKIEATLKDGLLSITLPKSGQSAAIQIPVSS